MGPQSQVTLALGFSIVLGIFIFFLFVLVLLILGGVFPDYENLRVIVSDNRPNPDWEATLKLKSESVFTVGQSITVDADLEALSSHGRANIKGGQGTPKLVFPEARLVDGSDAEIELQEDDGTWSGIDKIVFHKPGEMEFRYNNIGYASSRSLGTIETEGAYFNYKNQRFMLLFTVVTAMFAAGSLIAAIQLG